MMRRGDQYVESLRDGRAVYLDGERIADVTKHPAFVEPIRRIADRYDAARTDEARSITTCVDPTTGQRHGRTEPPPATPSRTSPRIRRSSSRSGASPIGTTPPAPTRPARSPPASTRPRASVTARCG